MIDVLEVTKKFGRKKVLQEVSFSAKKGEVTSLIGINGVGKTTILKAIMGLTPINSGVILVNGEPFNKSCYEKVTFIPDAVTMLPRMKLSDAMGFMADYYQSWNQERANELLTFFKLQLSDRFSNLSKGNAAKANLLLGLALDTDFILMDEPFSGIDIFSREQISDVFSSDLVEERGVLLTTHEINEIEHLIDKAVLLDEGHVIKEFYTEDVRENEGKSVIDVMREVYKG
ncbi:MAG TPA: ABC transporter ATP-binding protein [Candidatus Angelobacter sp.]|nr:ABC transporter ATP-binding protein [Candidatus Angelobacter sp.]